MTAPWSGGPPDSDLPNGIYEGIPPPEAHKHLRQPRRSLRKKMVSLVLHCPSPATATLNANHSLSGIEDRALHGHSSSDPRLTES